MCLPIRFLYATTTKNIPMHGSYPTLFCTLSSRPHCRHSSESNSRAAKLNLRIQKYQRQNNHLYLREANLIDEIDRTSDRVALEREKQRRLGVFIAALEMGSTPAALANLKYAPVDETTKIQMLDLILAAAEEQITLVGHKRKFRA